ncbi:ral guanine nucleotide dissociation stimulator-like [Castor canadensis]|uniref:Ral guanine nucleotide dissociation stimulator-like n=1 Tax=Castor canadensis TaxID=51338 RepID=A0AC58LGU3_CASCN
MAWTLWSVAGPGDMDPLPRELFKKVVPYHCLDSMWSQQDMKGKKYLAPTIRNAITQFETVVSSVITTCLGDQSLKASDRAQVVEHWIEVAMECGVLKNFSSLYAILSALQSNAIHHLKRTWEEVSRDSLRKFKKLSKTFSHEFTHARRRELLSKGRISKFAGLGKKLKRSQRQQKEVGDIKGIIPYLGTFLTDLEMLDNSMEDYLHGGAINFEKMRKEFDVISEIKLLQLACNNYDVDPHEHFGTWFRGMERLSEAQSYQLSCELESPLQSNSKIPKANKHTSIGKQWRNHKVPKTELSSSRTSHSKRCDQLSCGSDFSSGDTGDQLCVDPAGSTSSHMEGIHMSCVLGSPDGQDEKTSSQLSTFSYMVPAFTVSTQAQKLQSIKGPAQHSLP